MRQAAYSRGKISKKYQHPDAINRLRLFKPEGERPLEIIDPKGVVFGYRFRLPIALIEALETSTSLLPPLQASKHKRGSYAVRHYAHWADFKRTVYENAEYLKEKPNADAWLAANHALFHYLSDYLRIYLPEMWVSMTGTIRKATNGKLAGLASPWHGVAIGQGMGSEGGEDHQDWSDEPSVFNAVIPFGAQGWTGADILLWQLGLRVAVERGHCFLFKGAIIAHRATAVTSGQRNFVDLFCHKSVYDVKNRMATEGLLPKSTDARKVYQTYSFLNS